MSLSNGALTAAATLIEKALQLRPNSAEAHLLQRTLQDRRRDQERARERDRAVRAAIDRAFVSFRDGALEAAVRSTAEALAHDPNNEEAQALKQQAVAALEERRQQQELDQKASATAAAARRHASSGDYQRGLQLLKSFSKPHPLVDDAVREIAREAARVDELRRSEEQARQRARLDEEAKQRAQLDEEARQRAHAEAEATRQDAVEDEERHRKSALAAHEREEARQQQHQVEPWLKPEGVAERLQTSSRPRKPPLRPNSPSTSQMRCATRLEKRARQRPSRRGGRVALTRLLPSRRSLPPRSSRLSSCCMTRLQHRARRLLRRSYPGRSRRHRLMRTPATAPVGPPPSPPTSPGVGTLVLDALPWAEVVDIVDAAGIRRTLPPNATTPIFLELPPGDYDITLKNGSSRSVKVQVKAGEITQPAPLDFGQIDAAEYLRKLKW